MNLEIVTDNIRSLKGVRPPFAAMGIFLFLAIVDFAIDWGSFVLVQIVNRLA